ncbi:hypothetical protein [Streptomyces sp. NPDC007355]|uniref:hypothetical protein n=1 Tax=Streptomyces sp. NPDC007355 TaxID=3364778 RepID=UPI00367A1549
MVSTHVVVRALRSGATGVTVVHEQEGRPGRTPGVTARFGTVGRVRDVPELGGTAVEILFGRKLLKNQTAVVDVEWRVDPVPTESTHHQQAISAGLRECLATGCSIRRLCPPSATPTGASRIPGTRTARAGFCSTPRIPYTC